MQDLVSIIIVTYNSMLYIEPCLGSIKEHCEGVPHEVIVVDNASADGTPEYIAEHWPQVRLIRSAQNEGFAVANNRGYEAATGRWLMLLNADTLVLDSGLADAVQFMKDNGAALLGLRQVGADGVEQHTWARRAGLWSYIADLYTMAFYLARIFKLKHPHETVPSRGEFFLGAAMLVDRTALDREGLFDREFFFTCEERDLCMRLGRAGHAMYFYPYLSILHYGGSGSPLSAFQLTHWTLGSMRLARKHGGALAAVCMWSALACYFMSASVAFTVKGLLGTEGAREVGSRMRAALMWHMGLGPGLL